MDVRQDASRLHRHGVIEGIHFDDFVQPFGADDDAAIGDAAADQPGIAAHGDHRNLASGAQFDDFGQGFGIARAHDRVAIAVHQPALFRFVGRAVCRVGQNAAAADDGC